MNARVFVAYKTNKIDRLAALRHAVYCDVTAYLRPATEQQAGQFASNLSLGRFTTRFRAIHRSLLLRVTPDEDVLGPFGTADYIAARMADKYGERLTSVAGFYKHQLSGRWKINLPDRCFLLPYRDRVNFFAGFLCQPFDAIDTYFLLSSAKFDGPRAMPLLPADRQFFEQWKEPAQPRQNLKAA